MQYCQCSEHHQWHPLQPLQCLHAALSVFSNPSSLAPAHLFTCFKDFHSCDVSDNLYVVLPIQWSVVDHDGHLHHVDCTPILLSCLKAAWLSCRVVTNQDVHVCHVGTISSLLFGRIQCSVMHATAQDLPDWDQLKAALAHRTGFLPVSCLLLRAMI